MNNQKGITIVEALVTLVILSIGLIPVMQVLSSSTNITARIRNNLIAANLAQEGAEIIRGLRDANWFTEQPNFYDGLIGTWEVDWNTNWSTNPPTSTTISSASPIKFDSNTGLYDYSSGVDTLFKRVITVSLSSNPCNCELIVISQVDWQERSLPRSIQTESHLFNWR